MCHKEQHYHTHTHTELVFQFEFGQRFIACINTLAHLRVYCPYKR